jgi:hypothetical protein
MIAVQFAERMVCMCRIVDVELQVLCFSYRVAGRPAFQTAWYISPEAAHKEAPLEPLSGFEWTNINRVVAISSKRENRVRDAIKREEKTIDLRGDPP